ncbi:MAG: hypothetical protein K0R60_1174, partial [Microbacterium sp.]|nr:hypothetical protein [Microbacterium sp.]
MKLKFTLHRPGTPVDLEVTADGTSTVGDLARTLVLADPANEIADPGAVTLAAAESAGPRIVDPERAVAESGIRSGQTVQIVAAPAYVGDDAPAAVLRILTGPRAGSELPLRAGSNVVGRDRGADIVIDDALVSKRHARINVDAGVEIIDLGSANGLVMGGEQVARTTLSPDDVVLLGSTEVSVVPLTRPGTVHAATSTVEIVRSPRVVPRYEKPDFAAPKPPRPLPAQRLPVIALIAPLFMGAILYVFT